jgi:hypothetical protein
MEPSDLEGSGAADRPQAQSGSRRDAAATGRTAWEAWAERELADPGKRATAVDAAVAVLEAGASPLAAVVAARLHAGAKVPPAEARALWEELQVLDRVAAELATIQPSGDLTEGGVAELNRQYRARLQAVRDLYGFVPGTISTGSVQAGVGGGGASAPSPPRPSMREFFGDNSILIISIAGAFLLIVATLLFEIYGTTGFGGQVRFMGVLALNLIFGVAGYLCFDRSRLRLVGQTYLAIFALMTPLTIAAAWVFLTLESRGISKEFALGMGGMGCSILYAVLALRLQSRGYSALSMLALAVGWAGLLAWANAGIWMGTWLAALAFAYIAISYPPASSPQKTQVFTKLAEPFIHGAAVLSLIWAVYEWTLEFNTQSRPTFQLATTFGLLTVAYALYAWRSRRRWMLWAVWTGASLAVLATIEPLGFGQRGYVVDLAVLAWAFAIGVRWTHGRGLRAFVRCGAAVQAAIPVLLSASPDGLQAIALLTTSGIGVLFAIELNAPAWLLLAAPIFGVDWFWLAKSLLPPPPHATADTLISTYSPLPVVYALTGLGLRLTPGRRWSWPLYVVGGVVALGVAAGATAQGDLTLAGRALIVYAGIAYVTAALDRWWPGLLAALLAAAIAVLLLLGGAATATYWYPLAMTAIALAIYGAHLLWSESDLARAHRFSGIAIVALTAASSVAIPNFWQQASLGSVAALVALIGTAALVLVDGRRYGRPLLDYAAAAIASLGGFWIARYLGVDNVQADVSLPSVVLIVLGLIAPQDRRRPATLALCRAAISVGALGLLGVSAVQSVTVNAASNYTILWVVEAVVLILVGIGVRSRTLVVAGGAGLAFGALRALFIILQSVQVYVVFGAVAILLLVAAGVLAAARDRLAAARVSATRSWDDWT